MASLGAELKQAREQRGVTLEELSQSTKIGTRLLRALEQDHYDQLPGGIFTKGFIRAYARAVGVDDEKAIADYLAATEPSQPESQNDNNAAAALNRIVEVGDAPARDIPWGWFALVLLVVAVALTGWGFYSRHKANRSPRSPVAMPSVPQAVQSLPQPPANQVTPTASTKDHPPSPAAAKKPEAAGSAAAPGSDAAAGPYFSVRVNVREDSWLSISSDGKTVLQGTFAAPAVKSVRAHNQIVVKAGNVGGLDFEFNGKPLPPQGTAGELKSLVFGADGLEATEATPAPQ
jgi:cytoskeletal protein RodZ